MANFSYQIIPLHQVCDSQKDLVNDIYEMWENTFTEVLGQSGASLDIGDFFRCHAAGVLLYKDEVVGFNLFTNFDFQLHAHRKHPYFQELDSETLKTITASARKVMTMEYFTVSPLWRRQTMEVPWGEILAGLGLNYMDQSPAHLGLGTPRTDIKVDQMCSKLGASLHGHIKKMNYQCAIVQFDKKEKREFENPLTQHWVRRLWNKYSPQLTATIKSEFSLSQYDILEVQPVATEATAAPSQSFLERAKNTESERK